MCRRKISIPSEPKYIKKTGSEIEDFLKSNNIDASLIVDIRLSVEEAVKNAIIHGNRSQERLPVYLSYSLDGSRFFVEVEDQGAGFDPVSLPDPTQEEGLYKQSGRGVFLIKKLMDEVRYNDKGNKVSMVKYVKKK